MENEELVKKVYLSSVEDPNRRERPLGRWEDWVKESLLLLFDLSLSGRADPLTKGKQLLLWGYLTGSSCHFFFFFFFFLLARVHW